LTVLIICGKKAVVVKNAASRPMNSMKCMVKDKPLAISSQLLAGMRKRHHFFISFAWLAANSSQLITCIPLSSGTK
jgi:hypothetical protein